MTHPTPKANIIRFDAQLDRRDDLRALLAQGAALVERTEPGTQSWYALQSPEQTFGIFDTFVDAAAQEAHFEGQVAAALREQAPRLVTAGWPGVLAGVRSYDVLAETPRRDASPTIGMVIPLHAAAGRADALRDLLVTGAGLVAAEEPGTLHWLALQDDSHPDRMAIVDFFTDDAAKQAHFAGNVAAALQSAAPQLVVGGWEGVLKGAEAYEVVSAR
ncbi:MAG: antibiotic biosynthesis monooxygenase [Myxococcales bacterium]|nr:antibiotic biosynthesis monooxygenase [Myxococcales bacterium]